MPSAYDPIIIQPIPEEVPEGTTYYAAVLLSTIPGEDTGDDVVELTVDDPSDVTIQQMPTTASAGYSQPVAPNQVAYVFQLTAPANCKGKTSKLTAKGKNSGKTKTAKVKFK